MPATSDPASRLIVLSLSVLLVIMIGWLLMVGKSILMPIMIAILSVYVIATSSKAMARWPVTRRLPEFLRKILLGLMFILVLAALNWVVIVTARDLVALAPAYQANIERMITQGFGLFGLEENADWETIAEVVFGRIDMPMVIGGLAGSVGSMVGVLVLAVVYAVFLAAEATGFAHKLAVALPNRMQAMRTQAVIEAINARIGDYLAVKTLINVIVGTLSWAVLRLFGVDHALFWALMIGLLNYIPYFGSLFAVAFPVLMTMVQFGSIQFALLVLGSLTAINMWVGNWLEPRMIGGKVNMSPFVVVAALSFWTTLWGVAGAILAVPMTSTLAIILASFTQTRPFAVLLAKDVSEFEPPRERLAELPEPSSQ
ncbi:MAG: AI-2E family transporter [Pararhodobacter sp.]|nr:AI-2E family transporter [Pararhodobacter sp.]